MLGLKEENDKLKKQLEDLRNGYKNKLKKMLSKGIEPDPEDFYLAEIEGKSNDYDKLLNQQKEFKKYLEDEIKACKAVSDLLFNSNKEMKVYKEILTKYKEIMRISDEK